MELYELLNVSKIIDQQQFFSNLKYKNVLKKNYEIYWKDAIVFKYWIDFVNFYFLKKFNSIIYV